MASFFLAISFLSLLLAILVALYSTISAIFVVLVSILFAIYSALFEMEARAKAKKESASS